MPKKERGLGRGLDALLSSSIDGEQEQVREIPTENIHARTDQPRKRFEEGSLQELADSIREHGILQPVLVLSLIHIYNRFAMTRRLAEPYVSRYYGAIDLLAEVPFYLVNHLY